jgi:GNAT superfamily N-acetyltransferase
VGRTTRTSSGGAPLPGVTFAPMRPSGPWFDDAVRLYCATWPDDEDAIAAFFARYAAMLDYHGLVAVRDGRLVGFGFGVRSLPGNWWHDRVAEQVGPEHPALRDAWCLVDLAVALEARGRGIGGALMEELLAMQPCSRALLSTEVDNAVARRLYERHGWTYLHPSVVFAEGSPAYTIMRRELAGSRNRA